MKKVLQIVDSYEYVTTNGFQHQLLKTLRQQTDLITVPISNLDSKMCDNRIVLSTLKLGSVVKHVNELRQILGRIPLYIYDQDPWESFMDEGSYRGSYKMIESNLNVISFLNPSRWWCNHIISTGTSSKFFKIWILPEYCSYKSFEERTTNVGFMGQLHPFRQKTFETLKDLGVHVDIFPGSSYENYLERVSNMKFFIHYEIDRWHLNGQMISCNSLYGKTVEVMARGTFCFREKSEESAHWNLKNNPLLLEFANLEEIRNHIDRIDSLPVEDVNRMIKDGVDMIRSDMGWGTVLEAIE